MLLNVNVYIINWASGAFYESTVIIAISKLLSDGWSDWFRNFQFVTDHGGKGQHLKIYIALLNSP